MNRVDVHPEDLLDAAHAGVLDEGGRERLESHLERCAACALEDALARDLADDLAPRDGDDDRIDQLVRAAMGELRPAKKTKRRMVYAIAAALAVGLLAGAALAMIAMSSDREPEPAARRVVAAEEREAPIVVAPAPVAPEIAPAPAPSEEETPVVRDVPTAEELLARANAARREGDRAGAVRLYRRLQSVHPRSREAAISRVTLGRLLLDGMRDADGALREFDRYLAQNGHRVLEEEARVGRALALERLGRRAEEQRAWQDLLDHHPDTLYAERARARL